MSERPRVAVFRPNDDRLESAVALLSSLGVEPIPDPMLSVRPTGALPRTDAAFTILTSKTGVEIAAEGDWTPSGTTLCAIGPTTADAAEAAGYRVDLIPDDFTSAGLVEALRERVEGATVEVARSDHGSEVLLEGLDSAGAFHHETVLYELVIPEGAGSSVELATEGELDGALFTSSLTVEHFLEVADRDGQGEAAREGLERAVVGAIGPPTAETAAEQGIEVDVIPEEADFEALARATIERLGVTP
ncbi:MAG: uroporphyrinogen-III synthase [Halodesulfurarchaeum sp.]